MGKPKTKEHREKLSLASLGRMSNRLTHGRRSALLKEHEPARCDVCPFRDDCRYFANDSICEMDSTLLTLGRQLGDYTPGAIASFLVEKIKLESDRFLRLLRQEMAEGMADPLFDKASSGLNQTVKLYMRLAVPATSGGNILVDARQINVDVDVGSLSETEFTEVLEAMGNLRRLVPGIDKLLTTGEEE